jgi:hypothetical protein
MSKCLIRVPFKLPGRLSAYPLRQPASTRMKPFQAKSIKEYEGNNQSLWRDESLAGFDEANSSLASTGGEQTEQLRMGHI